MDERGTTCCYAKQDKFWVQGAPDSEPWEIYTVLEDSETFNAAGDEPCACNASATSDQEVCCS